MPLMECKRVYRDGSGENIVGSVTDTQKNLTLSEEIYWLRAYRAFQICDKRNKRI